MRSAAVAAGRRLPLRRRRAVRVGVEPDRRDLRSQRPRHLQPAGRCRAPCADGTRGRDQFGAGLQARRRAASRRLAARARRAVRGQQARAGHAGRPARPTRGLDVVVARPFNHIGPRQSADFVASQRRAAGGAHRSAARCRRCCGSATSAPQRDFTDVRDVVRAYVGDGRAGRAWRLLQRLLGSRRADPGSGARPGRAKPRADSRSSSIRRASVPSTCRVLVGSADKLRRATGWTPEIPLDRTLDDLLDWWRAHARHRLGSDPAEPSQSFD